VRDDDDVVHLRQLRFHRRLALVDVERRTGDLTHFQRLDERLFVHHRAAADVNQECTALHLAQLARVDEMVRLLVVERVQRNEVTLAQQGIHVHILRPNLLRIRLRLQVAVENPHVEAARALRQCETDAAEPDDAQRLVVDVGAHQQRRRPPFVFAAAHVAVGLDDAPRDRHQQHPGQVGGRVVEYAGGVGDRNAALGRGRDIDVVVADGVVGDELQLRIAVHQHGINRVDQLAQQDVAPRRAFPQLVACQRPVVGIDSQLGDFVRLLEPPHHCLR